MLHRLKLRLLYGEQLDADKVARRKKIRVILLSGVAVYIPFLMIAYFIAFETRVFYLLLIGFLSAITCIPVALYAYTKGFDLPFSRLWQERRAELLWLGLKIGFLYAIPLYFMILGIVEFLFGYTMMRAAMISFVASAVARDGFEIGYLRARCENKTISIFPDGRPILPFLKSDLIGYAPIIMLSLLIAGGIGFLLGPMLTRAIEQVIASGIVGGVISTAFYVRGRKDMLSFRLLLRFFLWPGFTMAVTYFLILAYLLRKIVEVQLNPAYDLALLMAVSSAWLTIQVRFVGYLNPLAWKNCCVGCLRHE